MYNQIIYDVVGIGFGPANISVAIAMEEFGFKGKSLFLESNKECRWQGNMLFENSDIQNHPLRDLVTPRNPRSKYSFTNFLHEHGRLFEHLNTGFSYPLRVEYAQYISWAASHFSHIVEYNKTVVAIERVRSQDDAFNIYKVTDQNGQVFYSHIVVIAPGRSPFIPEVFENKSTDRIFHL
ncbi:MAG: ornithine monooxygenase, partial [Flavobacterium sp.]